MSLGVKGWAAITAAACVAVLAVASALSSADKRADAAEQKTGAVTEIKRGETIRAETNAAVAVRTDTAASEQIRVERVTNTVVQRVKANAAAATPIDPALARDWVRGLRSMCDEAGPGACDGAPDRPDGVAGSKPVPARPHP
jgi:hypothetical protein